MTRRLIVALGLAAFLAAPAGGEGCTQCSCSIESDGLAFGSYAQRQRTLSVANIVVHCDGDNGYTIKLSAGSSGTSLQRTLRKGGAALAYNVFKDSARTMIWGDGGAGQTGLGGMGSATYLAYGEIFPDQAQPVGAYGDMLVLSIEY